MPELVARATFWWESGIKHLEINVKHSVIIVAFALSGCVTVTDANIETLGVVDLCTARIVSLNLGQADRASQAFDEIKRRGGFTTAELGAIQKNQVFVGMSEAAGLCAWGNGYDAVNTTSTAGGSTTQFVYSGGEFSKARYLYSSGGRITAFQT
jgi:hypothetical protein